MQAFGFNLRTHFKNSLLCWLEPGRGGHIPKATVMREELKESFAILLMYSVFSPLLAPEKQDIASASSRKFIHPPVAIKIPGLGCGAEAAETQVLGRMGRDLEGRDPQIS